MPTLRQVRTWAAFGESEIQEFKRSTGLRREAIQALCAMLNTRGGRVLIGVEDNGAVIGQQVGANTLDDVAQETRQIEPPVFPSLERVLLGDGKEVLVLTVTQGPGKPYVVRGISYRRVGSTTIAMSREEYNRMLIDRLHAERRWENELAEGWTVADLDAAEITRTLDEAIRRGRQGDPGVRDPESVLRGFGLIRDGALCRGAAVLFGKTEVIETRLPQCLLRAARFRGTDKSEFIDNRQFYGNAFGLLARADQFLRQLSKIFMSTTRC